MKICVWRTGHEIADTVADAVYEGLERVCEVSLVETGLGVSDFRGELGWGDIHIGYGILRGMDQIFKALSGEENYYKCLDIRKPWFNIDKGYFKPGHYDGYYRVSLNGTQQTCFDGLEPDYDRLDQLGIEIMPGQARPGKIMLCGPTAYVEEFFGMKSQDWAIKQAYTEPELSKGYINRPKGCERPLQDDLDRCHKFITFNSSVGWEALRQGIPVLSDETHSIVGAYQKLFDRPLHMDYDARRKLFALMASLQLTLDEIKNGKLWPLMSRLISSSAGMDVKQ